MSDYAVRVSNVTKTYRLGERKGSRLLSESIGSKLRRSETSDRSGGGTFNALEDVSFDVPQGEAMGIIGRNGAGKSTLLKLISRITRPTAGEIRLRGRIGSLLEVGTGFHPELTGRENTYMNGSMLGMRRAEIARKFDEIVAFADVEKFIDTPVKRYSSGMYVRLAFAVAAHLEPEILLVDEVLAVGDAAFQRKCLGKMGEVAGQGRTVLFVSHNMAAVEALTAHAVFLDSGRLRAFGPTSEVVASYLRVGTESGVQRLGSARRWSPDLPRELELLEIEPLCRPSGFMIDEPVRFRVRVRSIGTEAGSFECFVAVRSSADQALAATFSDAQSIVPQWDSGDLLLTLPARLAPGHYNLDVGIGRGYGSRSNVDFDGVLGVCAFEVAPASTEQAAVFYWSPTWGYFHLPSLEVELAQSEDQRGDYDQRNAAPND